VTEIGTPPKLMDDRMRHEDGSVQARYSHITAAMRQRLLADLTALWEESWLIFLPTRVWETDQGRSSAWKTGPDLHLWWSG
jgi:hypothetical protein